MAKTYHPKFHKNNTITYWHEVHGWIHRVHPLKISSEVFNEWRLKDRRKRIAMIIELGYVIRNGGQWVKK